MAKQQSPDSNSGHKLISSNPRARSDFFLEEIVEAGIALTGTEIKSIRNTSPNIKESFVEVKSHHGKTEAWIYHIHIAPYSHGNIWNHEPLRKRKLLLHRHQIDKLFAALTRDGMTLIPTQMYFKNGRVKVELALAKGKKKHDKRQDVKSRTANREMDRAMKQKIKR